MESNTVQTPSRLSSFGLVAVHAVAILILYFVPVFICPTVVDFYARFGIAETPLFLRAHLISSYLAAFTWLIFGLALLYLALLYWRKRSASRWLPAASNSFLLFALLFGMVYTAWLINPMIFAYPQPGVAIDSTRPAVVETSLVQIGG